MNKNTMIRQYRRFSAADGYVLGFEYKHTVYAIMVDEIMPRFMKVEKESSKKGGAQKLQLRITKTFDLDGEKVVLHEEDLLIEVQQKADD